MIGSLKPDTGLYKRLLHVIRVLQVAAESQRSMTIISGSADRP